MTNEYTFIFFLNNNYFGSSPTQDNDDSRQQAITREEHFVGELCDGRQPLRVKRLDVFEAHEKPIDVQHQADESVRDAQ